MEWIPAATGLALLVLGTVIGHQVRRMELVRQDRVRSYTTMLGLLTQWRSTLFMGIAEHAAGRPADPPSDPRESARVFLQSINSEWSRLLLVASPRVVTAMNELTEILYSDDYWKAVDNLPGEEAIRTRAMTRLRELEGAPVAKLINAMRKDLGVRGAEELVQASFGAAKT